MLPGATAALSKLVFMNWMDNVNKVETKNNPLVFSAGQREWGFYHHIMLDEFLKIAEALSSAFRQ